MFFLEAWHVVGSTRSLMSNARTLAKTTDDGGGRIDPTTLAQTTDDAKISTTLVFLLLMMCSARRPRAGDREMENSMRILGHLVEQACGDSDTFEYTVYGPLGAADVAECRTFDVDSGRVSCTDVRRILGRKMSNAFRKTTNASNTSSVDFVSFMI